MKVIKCEFATESDLKREDFKRSLGDFSTKSWSRVWEYPFAVLNSRLESGDEVLVTGCCGDELVGYFARRKMNVTGVDLLECKGKSFRFVQSDLRNMPFSDHSFDHVFCISVLEHLESGPFDALMELASVCKPNGRVIITVDYARVDMSRWDAESGKAIRLRFTPWDFYSFCKKLEVDAPELPGDVLKSKGLEAGGWLGEGLSVCGFVIEI